MVKRGILRDCIGIATAGMGRVAIEDVETHKVEQVDYEFKRVFKALERYKGKHVYWALDEFGLLARLELVKGTSKGQTMQSRQTAWWQRLFRR